MPMMKRVAYERQARGLCASCGREPLAPGSRWQGRICMDRYNARRRAERAECENEPPDERELPRTDGNYKYCGI